MARKQTAQTRKCAAGHHAPDDDGEILSRSNPAGDLQLPYTCTHDPDNNAPEPNLLQEAVESWIAFKSKYLRVQVKKRRSR